MRIRIASLAMAVAVFPLPVVAQQPPAPLPSLPPLPTTPAFTQTMSKAIDSVANAEIHARTTPGLAIGVVEDGLLVYAHGFGYANIAKKTRVSANTEFYAGAIAKTLTAASVLLLVQNKQVALKDSVTTYIPELSIAKNVTVGELLSQTSGLPDYTQIPGIVHDPSKPVKIDDLVKGVDKMQLTSEPGKTFKYNNLNYMLAGLIVQRVSGLPLSLFYQTHIFQPLIMTSTFMAGDEGIAPTHAVGYTRISDRFVPAKPWDPSWLFGSEGLVTNVYDLAKWDVGMPLLLNVDSVRDMWSGGPSTGDVQYGMGWFIDQRGGQRFVWHNGEIAGYHSMNALLPDQHVAVIVLANVDSLHGISTVEPERLANRILDIVTPLPPAHFANVVSQRAEEWLGRIARVDIDRTQLTEKFSAVLSDAIAERTDLKAYGPLVSMVPVESFQRSGDTVYVFDVKFQRGETRYEFALTPDGKIDGLYFQP